MTNDTHSSSWSQDITQDRSESFFFHGIMLDFWNSLLSFGTLLCVSSRFSDDPWLGSHSLILSLRHPRNYNYPDAIKAITVDVTLVMQHTFSIFQSKLYPLDDEYN